MSLPIVSTLTNAGSAIVNSLLQSKPMAMRVAILCLEKPLSWFTGTSLGGKEVVPTSKELEREPFNMLMLQACVNLINNQEATDDLLAPLVEEAFQEPTNSKAALKTVNFLIAKGIAPEEIAAEFSKLSIDVPSSVYTDWGLLNVLGHRSYMGSVVSNVKAIRCIGTQWICHNWAAILGTWAVVEMLSRIPRANAFPVQRCEAPRGSYQSTCDVKRATPYSSSDPHLKSIKFCEYTIDCHKLEWDKIQTNHKILTEEDKNCLAKMENCNGKLVIRAGSDALCTDEKTAKQYSDSKTEL
jgi:hypothetical protein